MGIYVNLYGKTWQSDHKEGIAIWKFFFLVEGNIYRYSIGIGNDGRGVYIEM